MTQNSKNSSALEALNFRMYDLFGTRISSVKPFRYPKIKKFQSTRQKIHYVNVLVAIGISVAIGCEQTQHSAHSIIVPSHSHVFEDVKNNIPMFILYYDDLSSFDISEPRVYFALWKDGKVLWGKQNGETERGFTHPEVKIEYFQATLSRDVVEGFLENIDKIDLGKHTGREIVPFGSPTCNLFFANNGCCFHLTIVDISWPNPPHEYPPRAIWDGEVLAISKKWQAMIQDVDNLIPKEGKRTILSFRMRSESQWVATLR